ncbi:periplasmic divalent cation tolerance protein [Thiohalobacter thiocyanaticus]|uniref:Periplasmic divalent cation tolerance protein n=2 Tax=Thiohalobacter thiocyanaticus TaxID=585455 RepID=A0A1Z4VN14_9GAMM|nr:periplasmic divalent cation tolerance protein [Thiohalobacter thiocyanaticus]
MKYPPSLNRLCPQGFPSITDLVIFPPMKDKYCIVLVTAPEADARTIARALVAQDLAACVNIVANLTSVYRWQGEVEEDTEQLLVIKTRRDVLEALKAAVLEAHPYELPEIIAVPIVDGLSGYLDWIDESVLLQ